MRALYLVLSLAVLAALLAIPAIAAVNNNPAGGSEDHVLQSDDDSAPSDDDTSPGVDDDSSNPLQARTTYADGNIDGCGCY
jgi:hypothetical protein